MAWISNYIHVKQVNAICHPCLTSTTILIKIVDVIVLVLHFSSNIRNTVLEGLFATVT